MPSVPRPAAADRPINTQPLTRETFAPFGDVLAPRDTFGLGDATEMTPVAAGSRTTFGIATFKAATSPLVIAELERHPHSKQTFAPLHGQRYLVVVAPNDAQNEPDLDRVRAFIAGDGQCISYGAGVWHLSMVVLDRAASFAVTMQKYADLPDIERRTLSRPISIAFD